MNRDGKQLQHSDWSLIKGNVTVLLDFPPTTHCTLLPFDDKIITNSPTQHFPYTPCPHSHMHNKELSSIWFMSWPRSVKRFQTDKNKQSERVINATVMLSVMNYMCQCFLESPKECEQLNICEHVCPAAAVTSKTAVYSWHHWQGCVCLCVRVRLGS